MNHRTKRKLLLRQLGGWTFAWVATEALTVFGHLKLWNENHLLTAISLAVNVVVGLAMIRAYRKLMADLDELEKKIQLESMALTLGLTLVVGLAYTIMDVTNLIPWDAEIGNLLFFVGGCYLACILVNTRRYC